MTNTKKKITLATIKSFVKTNASKLYVKNLSSFDGMTDCVQQTRGSEFRKVEVEKIDLTKADTLGINGAWFVRGSRDYFNEYNQDGFVGYEVYNCCGSFILAVPQI